MSDGGYEGQTYWQDRCAYLEAENARIKHEHSSIVFEELEKQLASYMERNDELDEKLTTAEAENERLKEQLKTQETQLLNLGCIIGDLRMEIASLQAELASHKLKWQTGPVPVRGYYIHKLGYFVMFHHEGTTPEGWWIGPIEMPEED